MSKFYFGQDDHSAREIFMKFGTPCFNCDLDHPVTNVDDDAKPDAMQYGFDPSGEIEFYCNFEFKHPMVKKIDANVIRVNRAVAKKMGVGLFVAIYFTKPAPASGPCPPGDGYGTAEQPCMFYVIPGNKKAHKMMSAYGSMDPWFTPARLARFMHWVRGSNISSQQLEKQGLTDDEVRYPLATKIDVKSLLEVFKGDEA